MTSLTDKGENRKEDTFTSSLPQCFTPAFNWVWCQNLGTCLLCPLETRPQSFPWGRGDSACFSNTLGLISFPASHLLCPSGRASGEAAQSLWGILRVKLGWFSASSTAKRGLTFPHRSLASKILLLLSPFSFSSSYGFKPFSVSFWHFID